MPEIPVSTHSTDAVEQAAGLTMAAWNALLDHRRELGSSRLAIGPLDRFLQDAEQHPLSAADKEKILDQATLLINELYPHLPFKLETFHFIHPVAWLNSNVRPFLQSIREIDFHGHVIAAFSLVRDAHTLYGLPSPFRGAVAFLPFQMRYYVHGAGRHYVVSKVMHGFEHEFFQPGAEITKWAGGDVDFFIQALAGRLSGGNTDALFTRGVHHSTLRPLTFCQPPSGEELPATILEYIPPGGRKRRQIQLPWGVATGIDQAHGFPTAAFSVSSTHAHAGNWGGIMHSARPAVQTPAVAQESRGSTLSPAQRELSLPSKVPEAFDIQFTGGPPKEGVVDPGVLGTDPPSDARFGYIRINQFSDGSALGNTDAIVNEFGRLLGLMDQVARDGLILDLRSNPGGDLKAAEQMIQMLTQGQISPTRFHLANTTAILQVLQRVAEQKAKREQTPGSFSAEDDVKLTDAVEALEPWLADAGNIPLPVGERLTSGQPLTKFEDCNSIGQVYQGRVILLIDALTYSAAEIFAAGFQDHAIGPIIGMDHNTGGGGANVWTHDDLLQRLGPMTGLALEPLPLDVTMHIAIRRNSRVGFFKGDWVEDVGVKADMSYIPDSADDVLSDYPGLTHLACNKLLELPQFRADVVNFKVQSDGSVKLELRTINIDSIDAYLDGQMVLQKQPVTRLANQEPSARSLTVPADAGNSSPARLKIVAFTLAPGQRGPELFPAAVRNVALQAPPELEEDAPTVETTDEQ